MNKFHLFSQDFLGIDQLLIASLPHRADSKWLEYNEWIPGFSIGRTWD